MLTARVCPDPETAPQPPGDGRATLRTRRAQSSRVLPLSNSCIMAFSRARVLSRRASRADSSASIAATTAAMTTCPQSTSTTVIASRRARGELAETSLANEAVQRDDFQLAGKTADVS